MAKQIVLKSEVSRSEICEDVIFVELIRVEREVDKPQSENPFEANLAMLPRSRVVGTAMVQMKNIFGYLSMPELAKQIVKAQNRLLAKYKATKGYLELVDRLCKEYESGEIVLQDARTAKLIDKFTK